MVIHFTVSRKPVEQAYTDSAVRSKRVKVSMVSYESFYATSAQVVNAWLEERNKHSGWEYVIVMQAPIIHYPSGIRAWISPHEFTELS